MLKIFIGVSVVFGFLGTANAQMTGNDLWKLCTGKDKMSDVMCTTWIAGFVSGMHSAQKIAKIVNLPTVTCMPDGMTGSQDRLIIEKFTITRRR